MIACGRMMTCIKKLIFGNTVMVPNCIKIGLSAILLISLALFAPGMAKAGQVEIKEGKLSIQAVRTPLQMLLKELSSEYGIVVRIDPAIDPPVTASFKNRDLEQGLEAILKPYNHVFIWSAAHPAPDHSAEKDYRLEAIHVFEPGRKDRMVSIDSSRPQISDAEARAEPAAENDNQASSETRVIIKGNKVFIPVSLGYENNEIQTSLVFDTGAGNIVLHENVARELGIDGGQASQGEGVGGIKIPIRSARLNYVRVGPYKKENLRVDIVSYDGEADDDYNGLLGMNFIRGLKYTIDFNAQVIKWNP